MTSASSPLKSTAATSSGASERQVSIRACFRSTPPKKSGNQLLDEQNKTIFGDLDDILSHCSDHPEDTAVLRRKARELHADRLKRAAENDGISESFTTFGTVAQLDSVVVSAWIVNNSDLNIEDLQLIKKEDNQGIHQLYSHAVQVGLAVRLPDDLRVVEVFNTWSTERARLVGSKLVDFKATGGMGRNGALDSCPWYGTKTMCSKRWFTKAVEQNQTSPKAHTSPRSSSSVLSGVKWRQMLRLAHFQPLK